MPSAVNPVFARLGAIDFSANITAANTVKDLSSGTVNLLFTADSTNGSFICFIVAKASGTNVATVARFFLNNGGVTTTAGNNSLWKEFSLPAITNMETGEQVYVEIPCGVSLPPSYRMYVLLGTAVVSGWQFAVQAGDH